MAERLLPTPEIPGSSPTIVHFLHNSSVAWNSLKNEEKRGREWPFKKPGAKKYADPHVYASRHSSFI